MTGVMTHPQFDPSTCENDVAIVKISPAVGPDVVGEFARVAKNGSYPKPGKKRAAGWYVVVNSSPPSPSLVNQH